MGAVTYNTRTATVMEIDYTTRKVVLLGEGGTRLDLKVGSQVKNFDEIKKGDLVKVQEMDSIILSLSKAKMGEKPSAEVLSTRETAPAGGMPGMEQVNTWQITAEVVDVDQDKSWVELKGPLGNVLGMKVKDPDNLKEVRKGDMVTAVYTDALAISVMPMPR